MESRIMMKKLTILLLVMTMIITVYADLQDNVEITNISTIDPADFNE